MNEIFNFNGKQVRTIILDSEPFFVGKDVADILGYSRADNAIRSHVDDDDKLMHQFSASGQNRNMIIINESRFVFSNISKQITTSERVQKVDYKRSPASNTETRGLLDR